MNETSTSLQAKLRRVTAVVAQDLRSAVFGGSTDTPVVRGARGPSFTLADQGQGYEVLSSGGNGFPNGRFRGRPQRGRPRARRHRGDDGEPRGRR